MKRKMIITITAMVVTGGFLAAVSPAFAGKENDDLKKQVEQLQKKVDELEGALGNKAVSQSAPAFSAPAPRQTWDPYTEMDRIRDEMNMMFQDSFSRGLGQNAFGPGVFSNAQAGIEDAKDHYIVKLDMPGMDKADINIEVKGQQLLISGEKKESNEQDNKAGHYYSQESSFGYFSQIVPLPEDADPGKIDASYDKGVLTVSIAKTGASKKKNTRKIAVK
jgi:HSP20 family protein